jgi:beta-lactamase class A
MATSGRIRAVPTVPWLLSISSQPAHNPYGTQPQPHPEVAAMPPSVFPPHPAADPQAGPAPDPTRRAFLGRLGVLLGGAFGLTLPTGAAAQWYEPPPVARPNWPYRAPHASPSPPRPWYTNDLNATIQRYLTIQRRTGRVAPDERTAWLVYDFTSGRFLVTINAGMSYQSASMIKPFIALAFFHKVREGSLHYTPLHRQRMEAMIQRSDNKATNYFIELLNRTSHRSGPAEAEHTLKRRNPGIFRHTRIVEPIPRGGRSYRNKASALDYHRFLQALWYDHLPYSGELKRLLYLPNRDRIYTGAAGVARQTQVFDKTGTTARLCGDMGILVAQGRDGRRYPYTFIGIIEKARPARNYVAWKNTRGNVIREVSSITYGHLRQMYDLV